MDKSNATAARPKLTPRLVAIITEMVARPGFFDSRFDAIPKLRAAGLIKAENFEPTELAQRLYGVTP